MNFISFSSITFVIFSTFNNINVEGLKARIFGGLPVKPREVKYLVGIRAYGDFICGGGIIGEKYILTAAHCVSGRKAVNPFTKGTFQIIAGSDNLNAHSPSSIIIDVKKFYIPKVYEASAWHSGHPDGDIAVLELKNKLNLSDNKYLQKLELPSLDVSSESDSEYTRIPAETAGFGVDSVSYETGKDGKQHLAYASSRRLLKAKVEVLDRSVCQKSYSFNIPKAAFCGRVQNYLGRTHQGTCRGDSGGPLVQNGTTVIGVISSTFTYICNDNLGPSIFTKVAPFKKFIENVKQGITDEMRVEVL